MQISNLEQDIVAHTDGDDTLSIAQEEAARELSEVQAVLETARQKAIAAATSAAEWRAKAQTLELSLAPEDATAWLVNEHRHGVSGLVRDQLKIASGWEAAVEAALQGAAAGAVISSVDAGIDALRAARETNSGHLELLVAGEDVHTENADSAAKSALKALSAANLEKSEAILAADALTANTAANSVARYLLNAVILAVDLSTARKLLTAGAPKVVTLAGDVLTPSHISGGEIQISAVLARQAMYEDARIQEQQAVQEKTEADSAVAAAEAKLSAAQEEFAQISAQLSARDSRLAAVSAQLGVLRQSLKSAEDEVVRNQERQEKIAQELENRQSELAELTAQQDEMNQQPEDNKSRLADLTKEREAAHKLTIAARTDETQARLTLRTKEERLRAISGKSAALENQAQAVEARIAQEERQAARRAELAAATARISQTARLALAHAQELLTAITVQRQEAENERAVQDTNLSQSRKDLENLQTEQRTLDELAHRRELALAQLRAHYEQLSAKAIDDLGMEAQTLIDEYGPHLMIEIDGGIDAGGNNNSSTAPESDGRKHNSKIKNAANVNTEAKKQIPFVRAEQEKRLARAERDLARLGKINPLALEEHAALEERQRFLTEQLQDLRRSREDLLKIVRDIDQRVNEVMSSAFADVASEFTKTFARLFPGGEGQLRLTDPDSPLTTGIDIEARPPGKRVKRLSLLSGGERSLTAVAFLVSIFKARPSPFYVMDEVEAALDDVNLSRLIEIFKELQDSSQLLVITHQKRTMEIADALYGVAMKEQGVSTVISQRLQEIVE
ncbi:AAA family ATPase [Arcanobacterium hippocoleae]